jgi:histidyl-tRNA synthetase
MGDVVLGELLRARGLMQAMPGAVDVWIAGGERTADMRAVMELAARLRGQGIAVEYALRPQQLGKQFKSASTAGAKQAVIVPLANDGAGSAEFTIRDLASGEQVKYSNVDEVVRALASAARPR